MPCAGGRIPPNGQLPMPRKTGRIAGTRDGQHLRAGAIVSLVAGGNCSAGAEKMQVFCKSTAGNAEIHCSVCGQGFVMFWERQSRVERVEMLREIHQTLRHQHRNQRGPEAHPNGGFLVPEWDGSFVASGGAIPGHVPSWEL